MGISIKQVLDNLYPVQMNYRKMIDKVNKQENIEEILADIAALYASINKFKGFLIEHNTLIPQVEEEILNMTNKADSIKFKIKHKL